ncbi:MAG: response regulator transcription factor [Terriglobales bacterium]
MAFTVPALTQAPPLPAPGRSPDTAGSEGAPILLIEDDPHIRRSICYQFQRQGYKITCCEDGESGLDEALRHRYSVVVLDLMLPKLDGLSVCRQLRETRRDQPIIIISARGSDMDKITGLGLGADDYLTKPFSPAELEARVRALRRRADVFEVEPIRAGGMVLDCSRHHLTVGSILVHLTPKEMALLKLLMGAPGRVFTRENLLAQVWGSSFEGYNRAVDAHMSRLKTKILEQAGTAPEWLESIYGVGYRFRDSLCETGA